MKELEAIELQDCPICGGVGLLEITDGTFYNVSCLDCGNATVPIEFRGEADRAEAAQKAAELWNFGKAVFTGRGD